MDAAVAGDASKEDMLQKVIPDDAEGHLNTNSNATENATENVMGFTQPVNLYMCCEGKCIATLPFSSDHSCILNDESADTYTDDTVYMCDICSLLCKTYKELLVHFDTDHRNEYMEENTGEKPFYIQEENHSVTQMSLSHIALTQTQERSHLVKCHLQEKHQEAI